MCRLTSARYALAKNVFFLKSAFVPQDTSLVANKTDNRIGAVDFRIFFFNAVGMLVSIF